MLWNAFLAKKKKKRKEKHLASKMRNKVTIVFLDIVHDWMCLEFAEDEKSEENARMGTRRKHVTKIGTRANVFVKKGERGSYMDKKMVHY